MPTPTQALQRSRFTLVSHPIRTTRASRTAAPLLGSIQAAERCPPWSSPPPAGALAGVPAAAPLGVPPSPSPSALSDPYATGGSLSTAPPVGGARAPVPGQPKLTHPQGHFVGRVLPPGHVPKWLKYLSILAIVGIVLAVIFHMMTRSSSPSTPPPVAVPTCPPVAAEMCPPVAAAMCPPVAAACPPVPEAMVLRLAKGDAPLVVKVEEQKHHHRGRDEDSCAECDSRCPLPQRALENPRGSQKPEPAQRQPVIIVNEPPPVVEPSKPSSLDLWELTYAPDNTAALPRMSDTNMVYARVGGSL